MLSQLSDNVGIVVSPASSRDILQHIEFVRLPDSRILAITVSSAGRVTSPSDSGVRTAIYLSSRRKTWYRKIEIGTN